MPDSKERFSSRVENYIRYRPGYPSEIIELLRARCGLNDSSTVADIGSGTGIFARLLLPNVKRVSGVEPNREMREAAERLLKDYSNFQSVAASGEQTGLESNSVDFVTAAQAFHWFNQEQSRSEFLRILKPSGWVVLIWNERRVNATPFLRAYEDLLQRYSADYSQVDHRRIDEQVIGQFFGSAGFAADSFENTQCFDFTGLKGRLLSSSYTPIADHPNYQPMLTALENIFTDFAADGSVVFEYDTRVYYGRLS